jgi:glycosyltransferase involved in cell wall biosynthesis
VLNDYAGLKRTIDSIIRQRQLNYELVIVDGGSTDGSADLAKQFSNVQVESRPDGGIYRGMQRGAEASTGEYLIFCNAGDELFGADFLCKAADNLNKHQDHKSWGFGPIIEHTLRNDFAWVPVEVNVDLKRIANRNVFIPFPSVIMSKALFYAVGGFDFGFKIAADFDLILRCAKKSLPITWDFPLAIFYAGGISYINANLAWKEEHESRIKNLEFNFYEKLLSFSQYRLRVLKWRFGKVLDFFQKVGFMGNFDWRNFRGKKVPSDFLKEIMN